MLAKDVLISRGNADILNNIEWQVMPGERWGIVGPNGAGKSTLLNALLGTNPTIRVQQGSVRIKPGLEVGYLEQTSVGGADTTLRTEVMSRMRKLVRAQEDIARLEALIAG